MYKMIKIHYLSESIIFFLVVILVLALTSIEGSLDDKVSQIFDQTGQPVTQSPHGFDIDVDDFAPYNQSRHDEFDWQLIKVK